MPTSRLVCGCDDKSYSNACGSERRGVSVAKGGPSRGARRWRRRRNLRRFDRASSRQGRVIAIYPSDAAVRRRRRDGVCEVTPQVCDDIYSPVCGLRRQDLQQRLRSQRRGCLWSPTRASARPSRSPNRGRRAVGSPVPPAPRGSSAPIQPKRSAARETSPASAPRSRKPATRSTIRSAAATARRDGNECDANMAGTSPAREGECEEPAPGQTCGGFIGEQCPGGQYCDYAQAGDCGFADGTGVCAGDTARLHGTSGIQFAAVTAKPTATLVTPPLRESP